MLLPQIKWRFKVYVYFSIGSVIDFEDLPFVKSHYKLSMFISSTSIRQTLLFNPFTCIGILLRHITSMGKINNCYVGFILDDFVNIVSYILFTDHITATTFNNIMVIMLL